MAAQQRAIRTRRAILQAAATVFDEQGYDAANIAEILARAGVTKGAMYFHFASKEALAETVMLEHSRALPDPPPDAPLQAVIDLTRYVGHQLRKNPMMRAGIRLATEQGTFRSHGAPVHLGWIEILDGHLQHARKEGQLLETVETRTTAEFIVGAFTGLQMLSQELSEHGDLQRRITTLWNYVLPQIATPDTIAQLNLDESDPDA